MADYLAEIKDETVKELEREMISVERLNCLQNRLYVIKAVQDKCLHDITSGRLAEERLREEETDAEGIV